MAYIEVCSCELYVVISSILGGDGDRAGHFPKILLFQVVCEAQHGGKDGL